MKRVVLRGGLGNQLFGLAFADTVATLSGAPVAIDPRAFDSDPHGRRFETAALARDYGFHLLPRPPPRGLAWRDAWARLTRSNGQVFERPPPADPDELRALAASGERFDGYWQDEAWFARPDEIRGRTRAFLDRRGPPAPAHDVVIHLRTYREERAPSRRTGPGPDYLRGALAEIQRRYGATRDIVLVSDDPAFALARLGELGHGFVAEIAAASSDMSLLLRARALALSNSSFSWWAGYCGDAGLVAYPRRAGQFHYPTPAGRFVII